ncbi:ABC transporter permease [Clostridium boliviensis]|uniref:ABC transporter permease n=1 Tax=Clostridium boliviensis TaxID=318465 RepID=A0ABU4GV00_9CLOT|nr:ABC transporter permease [Clostridium boliviensis]MDW2800773.1 ABC transporter permease [Clostridium boliviensis]
MRTFITTLTNIYERTIPRLVSMILLTVFTLASMVLAVHLTGVQQVKGRIVLVTDKSAETLPQSSARLNIVVSPEKPPYSALVEQKYDAYVTIGANGDYQIETLRDDDYKNMVLTLLKNSDAVLKDSKIPRGAGANIIGFMMMFVLMQVFANLFAFADDKEQGQLRRITTAPVSFWGYLTAHCTYCLSMFVPEYILLIVLKSCGFDIGFTLLQYAGLLAVLGLFGISFALLLYTLIDKPDNASMLGRSIVVLTSMLAGSFYLFSKKKILLDLIIKVLPQKQLMIFVEYMERGEAWHHGFSIIYVIAVSVVMFMVSCFALRMKYIKRV